MSGTSLEQVCSCCGMRQAESEMVFARDPYAEEILFDSSDETNPLRWWCKACINESAMGI